jgi:GMP synthase-like glutamine amidotransferase
MKRVRKRAAAPKVERRKRKPVLLVQHAPHEHPAALRRALESQGVNTLWIHPYRGENYPDVDEISGMVSLGGPMGANDEAEHPWISAECELIRQVVLKDKPIVGICLGGQMMAKALGGRVEKHVTSEIGWFPIRVNATGKKDRILGAAGSNPTVYHWHGDTFFPPSDAELLASSQACPRQAYRIGEKVYGFQFHPEADHQLVGEWLSIEGVEQEIVAAQKLHGTTTVQDAETQIREAGLRENHGLKIVTAVASLFRKKPFEEPPGMLRTDLKDWVREQTPLTLEFLSSEEKPVRLKGRVLTVLDSPAGAFIIFKEETSLLWPVRVDDIKSLRRASD